MHCFASENQTYTGTWLFGVESWKSLKGQENLLLKNLQVKTRVENVRFLSWRIFFVGKYGIQSTNEMAFKRTVPLREFSISRHQIWCAHAIVVQRIHACACKMPYCSIRLAKGLRIPKWAAFKTHKKCGRRAARGFAARFAVPRAPQSCQLRRLALHQINRHPLDKY